MSGVEIRATHPYGYRSGEWALITGVVWANDHPCFEVRFPDYVSDTWVLRDPSDPYEFRRAHVHDWLSGAHAYQCRCGAWELEQ